jgi:hypothetical protein
MSVGDFCSKMKSTADTLQDLGYPVPEHVLALNVVRGLSESYAALRTMFTHQKPTPTFLQLRDALTLEELTRGLHTPPRPRRCLPLPHVLSSPPRHRPSRRRPPLSLDLLPPGRAGVLGAWGRHGR